MDIYGSVFEKSLDENLNLAQAPRNTTSWVKASDLEGSAHCESSGKFVQL